MTAAGDSSVSIFRSVAEMSCPYCLEDVKSGAKKCPHCQSTLGGPSDDERNVVYILDKGLVRFGKFVGATLTLFLLIGTYFYGLDFKDAIKKTGDAEIAVKRGIVVLEEQRSILETKIVAINSAIKRIEILETEIIHHRDEVQGNAASIAEIVGDVRQQKEFALQLVQEMRIKSLSTGQEVLAATRREELGIDLGRGRLWKNGSEIRIGFLDGLDEQKTIVRKAIEKWEKYINLRFKEVSSDQAEIRISFKQEGSWSYIGTDALALPKDQPTINYGYVVKQQDKAVAETSALHEFGHALGLVHEHQNPSAKGLLNPSAAEEFFTRMGFSRQAIEKNMATDPDYPGERPFDPSSIMNYGLPASLFVNQKDQTRPGNELSDSDKQYIASLYPRS